MLTEIQKELLFDYCLGLTSQRETFAAMILVISDDDAAELCTRIKAVLAPLRTLNHTRCPDYLAEQTITAGVAMIARITFREQLA
ncbi:MAG: hypothetical protein JW720_07435 [Sedimentisphaerales bacterium]|nr:hypothetical protein [Sedimentisphaerales bacterium]